MNPTPYFLFVWIAAIVLWDVWVFAAVNPEWTVSATLLRWAAAAPALSLAVVFGLGVLSGHLFWPQEK